MVGLLKVVEAAVSNENCNMRRAITRSQLHCEQISSQSTHCHWRTCQTSHEVETSHRADDCWPNMSSTTMIRYTASLSTIEKDFFYIFLFYCIFVCRAYVSARLSLPLWPVHAFILTTYLGYTYLFVSQINLIWLDTSPYSHWYSWLRCDITLEITHHLAAPCNMQNINWLTELQFLRKAFASGHDIRRNSRGKYLGDVLSNRGAKWQAPKAPSRVEWKGVSPRPTRRSVGASWAPPVKSGADRAPAGNAFWRNLKATDTLFCTYNQNIGGN